jgi:gliding motility-associated-like protein
MKQILTIVFLLLSVWAFAQPANDNCSAATAIATGGFPYNSGAGAFTTVGATNSISTFPGLLIPPGNPPNWTNTNRDVWFTFNTPANGGNPLDLTITITMASGCQPMAALYEGSCALALLHTDPAAQGGAVASHISAGSTLSFNVLGVTPNAPFLLVVNNGILPNAAGCAFSIAISEYCAPINMSNGSSNFCNNSCTFFDSGGPAGDYGANENFTYTICPPNPQGCLVLDFSTYDIDCIFDGLRVYNGNSTSAANLITTIRGTGTNLTVEVPSGCATLVFQSNTAISGAGWAMTWSCTSAPCTPTSISDCDNATPVTSLPFTGNYSTCGAGDSYDATDACGSGYMSAEDYTFAYTSPGNECISVSLSNTSISTGLFILDGCPNADATSCIATIEAAAGNPTSGSIQLTDPGTYYIVVSGAGCPTCTDFDIIIDQAACPMIVNPNVLALDLTEKIAGKNVDITNVQLNCPPGAYGVFEGGPGAVNIQGGIILSTGFADDAEGPNTKDGTTVTGQDANTPIGSPGDPLLTQISGVATVDACVLEFDVYAPRDLLTFNYVFMSEEYLEFIGNFGGVQYNDVFAFTIRGPGILDGATDSLISAVPNSVTPGNPTGTPITINSINNTTNSAYYINNPAGEIATAYDGYTTVIQAAATVIPCNTYHLRLAIADGLDQFFDSGVLIEAGSLFNNGVELEIAGAQVGNALSCAENCLDGSITISLVSPQTDTVYVPVTIQGTALNGIDYLSIPDTLVFPPGVTSFTIPIIPITDGLVEGTENVVIYLYEVCSDSIPSDSAIIYIQDDISGLFALPPTATVCGEAIEMPMTGPNYMFYSWTPTAGLSNPTVATPMVFPSQNTTYTVIAGNGICSDTFSIDVTVATLNITADTILCLAGQPVQLFAVTNQPNPTYTWSPSTFLNSTTSPTPIATPTTTTTYNVQIATPICTIDQDVTITVFEGAAVVVPDQTICLGESLQIGGAPQAGLTYSWSPIDGLDDPTSANPTATPDQTTTYTLTVTGGNCSASDQVTITVGGQFTLLPIANTTIFQGSSTPITATPVPNPNQIPNIGTINYSWTPTTGVTGTNQTVSMAPLETTTYTVTAESFAGCTAATSFTITVIPPVYNFPNAFTPNGTGENNTFRPILQGEVIVENFQVFNRWGQVVFDNGDATVGWDGTINGQAAPQDTYVYVATLRLPTGEVVEEKGDLLLIR